MAEKKLRLSTYLIGGHLVEAAQQVCEGALVTEHRIDPETAHPAACALIRERCLATHLTFGSSKLIFTDAVLGNLGERCAYQLQNRRQLARRALPLHAP